MANISIRKGTVGPLAPAAPEWEPLRRMRELFRWEPFGDWPGVPQLMSEPAGFLPAFDLKETQGAYEVKADLPGVKEQDVEIAVTGDRLTIRGKRESEQQEKADTYYTYERSFGSFVRQFTLPSAAEPDEAHAELRDGVLTVSVPKRPEAQPRRIPLGKAKS